MVWQVYLTRNNRQWIYERNNIFGYLFFPALSSFSSPCYIDSSFWLSSSSVNTKREPQYSSDPSFSQFTLYARVTCFPMILIVLGRSEYSFFDLFWTLCRKQRPASFHQIFYCHISMNLPFNRNLLLAGIYSKLSFRHG